MSETKNIIAIPLAILVAGALISGAIYFTRGGATKPSANTNVTAVSKATEIKPVSGDDHIRGNPEAPVVIVEYSDTECPFCKSFHSTMNQIIDEYGKDGKVAWVYRHFPLEMHPKARKEAEATECAGEIGGKDAFWEYIDEIFARTPSNNGLEESELAKVATDIGLDSEAFAACMESGKFADLVETDYQSGIAAGVEGTPFSFVVVRGSDTVVPINGAQPYSVVKEVIDTLIGGDK